MCRLFLAFILLVFTSTSYASRLPDSGGSVHVALPENIEAAFLKAHTSVPLLVRGGLNLSWSSELITSIETLDNSRRWVFGAKNGVRVLARAIRDCLDVQKADDSWPAAILSTADIQSDVAVFENRVELKLTKPFGPLKGYHGVVEVYL